MASDHDRRAIRPLLAVVLVVLLVLTGCSGPEATGRPDSSGRPVGTRPGTDRGGSTGTGPAVTTPDGTRVVKVGALVSKTGPGAPYGVSQLKGVELGITQLNQRSTIPGVRFELVVRDDGSDAEQARKAMTELIDDEGVIALFGPTLSSVAAQVDRIAVAAGVPVMAISNTTLDILTVGEPFWRVALTNPAMAEANLAHVRERFGVRRAALVHDPTDRRSREQAEQLRAAAAQAGVTVTGEVEFTSGITDFGPTVEQAQTLDVEVLLVAAADDDARGFFGAIERGQARLDFNIIGNSVWRVALSERTMIPKSVATAKTKRGVTRAVVVFDPNDPYSKGAADAFRAAAANEGVSIVDEITFASNSNADFGPALGAATTRGANGFFVAALGADASRFLDQRLAAGQTGLPLVGGAGFQNVELVKKAGPAAAGLIGGAAWIESSSDAASSAFVEEFDTAFRQAPDQWAALGYGGVQLVSEAMRAGGGATRSAIRSGLVGLKDAPTVLGPVTFSEQREAQYPVVVQIVQDGAFVPVT